MEKARTTESEMCELRTLGSQYSVHNVQCLMYVVIVISFDLSFASKVTLKKPDNFDAGQV